MEKVTRIQEIPCSPGARLKALREEKGWNQALLAEKVGELQAGARQCSEKSISMLENGKRQISRNYAHLFAQVFGVKEEYILCESDYPTAAHELAALKDNLSREGSLLFTGFNAFAELNGYTVRRKPPAEDVFQLLTNLHNMYSVEKDGMSVPVSVEELNELENEICALVNVRLMFWFDKKAAYETSRTEELKAAARKEAGAAKLKGGNENGKH